MKHTLTIVAVAFGVILGSSFVLGSSVAHAQGAAVNAPGQHYNLTFQFRNQNRVINSQTDLRQFIQDIIAYLQELRDKAVSDSEVEVETRSAISVTDDSAKLRGEVTNFNDSSYATVWFEYGRSSSALTTKTNVERLDDGSDGEFDRTVSNLRDDTSYYFRAVARDDEEDREYGSVLRFDTDKDNTAEEYPEVITQSATAIGEHEADLRGVVDMNDFRNGEVFFVYGEAENQIEDVADDFTSYADIDEDGEDLQKVRVDTNLDGSGTYREEVAGLDANTDQYFSICVGYEDEDNNETLQCGDVRSFVTD